ncbi:ATP-binding protein [Streptomyces rubiginosohelvolus]|uniref:ATP-binding protein n=1 Tax=Streptomyces rubiginosohelvolus TaxID=67362 RepID=UPI0037248894
MFNRKFVSEPRGARLARRVGLYKLRTWGIPHLGDASESAALIIGELTANAVTHGRVAGRTCELRLSHMPGDPETPGLLRIEVSDTRGECRPPRPGEITAPADGSDSGRGLLIVEALADRWAVFDRSPGTTVRVEPHLLY